MADLIRYLVVMLGAAIGGLTRYLAGVAVAERYASQIPDGSNFSHQCDRKFRHWPRDDAADRERYAANPNWRLFVVVQEFIGGYTTFSSFEWETFFAARNGAVWIGLLYVLSECRGRVSGGMAGRDFLRRR